jgi:hypothetical protein
MLTFKMFEILLPLVKIRFKIGVLGLGTFHLSLNKNKNDETNFKIFENLLLLVKIKFKIRVLSLVTPHLCSNKGGNDETTFKMFKFCYL